VKKKLLIITYHYPPDPSSNPYPTSSWAKYLSDFGWEPIILTSVYGEARTSNVLNKRIVYRAKHEQAYKMLVNWRKKIPSSKLSFKLLNFLLINFLLYPDEKRGWFEEAFKTGLSIAEKYPISIILSVGAPWTDHCVASALSMKLHIPWIADYRDPWTQKTSAPYRVKWLIHNSISRVIEKKIVNSCSCCLHASDIWAEQLTALLKKRVFSIPNGYDLDDFSHVTELEPTTEKINISYVGTLHFTQRLDIFLEGFDIFVKQSKISERKCRLNLIGTGEIALIKQKYQPLGKYIHYIPYVSKEAAISYMAQSHILLLFLNDDTGWYPTKAFEYLACGRAILASPDNGGVISELLRMSGSGVALNSPEEIALWLEETIREFHQYGNVKISPNIQYTGQYERKNLTERLSGILNDQCR